MQTERLKRIVEGDWGVCGGLGVAGRGMENVEQPWDDRTDRAATQLGC